MRAIQGGWLGAMVVLWATAGCWNQDEVDGLSPEEWAVLRTMSPLEAAPEADALAIQFGRMLFFDGRVSGNGNACATCHDPEAWFRDSRPGPTSLVAGEELTPRQAFTLVNSAYEHDYNWDGKFESVQQEIMGRDKPCGDGRWPGLLENRHVLGGSRVQLAHLIHDHYGAELQTNEIDDDDQAQIDAICLEAARVIGVYVGQLVSRDAPFDAWVAGHPDAISESAKRGARLFVGKAFCVECHSGPTLSDHDYHVTGIAETRPPGMDDVRLGRGLVTCEERDEGRFKTPTLRQVAMTAPYMHSGTIATLGDVISFYDRGGDDTDYLGVQDGLIRPLGLTDEERADLEAFLETLTGAAIDPALRDPTVPP